MRDFLRRTNLSIFSYLRLAYIHSTSSKPDQYEYPAAIFRRSLDIQTPASPLSSSFSTLFSSFTPSSNRQNPNDSIDTPENTSDEEEDNKEIEIQQSLTNEVLLQNVKILVHIMEETRSNAYEMKKSLDQCEVTVSPELVSEVLSRVRYDWEAAFTFFLWAGKQPNYGHSLREYHSMISILGKMRKFDTAWALIDEMRASSLITPQTLVIMIRRYCAVHDVGKAINTFYAHKRFKFDVGIEEFQNLLSALCRYKNVSDAEHLLFCNQNVFPLSTKSFNIILNGWCNLSPNTREAERFWMEMRKRKLKLDVVSFASIISCYSKTGNLNKVLKLFNQMKQMGIEPDRKVYNAVIHSLAKGGLVKEAINLMKSMEEEKGIVPNAVTYNSLMKPLCKLRRLEEAREVFTEMVQRGVSPTIRTYHALFRILRTGEQVFGFLENMRRTGCCPNHDTYIMLIRKLCRWQQIHDVFKLWKEMIENGFNPDRSSYIVMIHGLFLNGKLEEAHKFYVEMKEKQLLPEPKTEEMIQAWVSGKKSTECQLEVLKVDDIAYSKIGKKTGENSNKEKYFRRLPERRVVAREKGFSFWDH